MKTDQRAVPAFVGVLLLMLSVCVVGVGKAAATPAPGVGTPTATPQVLAAALSWPAPGETAVDGYRITVSPGGAVVDVPVPVTGWVVQGLSAGTSYRFTVRAVVGEVAGEASELSNAVVPRSPGGALRPLQPARILDTRDGTGAPAGPLGAQATLTVPVLGTGGIPEAGVESVVLNVTGVGASTPTHLTIFPTGTAPPTASNLNLAGREPVPNLVEVKVGVGGAVSVFNNAGTIDVIFDVTGYVLTPEASVGSEGQFTPLSPARILDTREGVGAPMAKVGPTGTIELAVAGHGGVPATGVGAVVLNVTATGVSADTYVTAYPGGASRPETSNLNVLAGRTVPNRVIVKVGADGKVVLFNRSGSLDLIADVSGWFAAAGSSATGATFTGTDPARVFDTRDGVGGPATPVVSGAGRRVQIAGAGGVPSMDGPVPPTAVVANITVTAPTHATFLVAWPHQTPKPLASDLNFAAGQTVPNLAVVKLGGDGAIDVDIGLGSAQVIIDVLGWYAGDQATAWNLEVVPPASIVSAPEGSITFTAPIPAVTVGSLVASAIGPATPGGLLRRVVGVSGATVATTDAEISDAIVNGQLSTGPADQATPPTFPPDGLDAAAAFLGTEQTIPISLPGGGIGLSGSLESKFRIGIDLTVSTDDTGLKLEADAGVSVKSTLSATLGVNLAGSHSASVPLPSAVSTPMLFFVGAVPFVVRVRIDPQVDVAVSGKVQLGTTVSMSRTSAASIRYANGTVLPITSTSTETPTFTPLTAKGNAELKASIKVPLGLEINALARFSAGFAPYVRAHVDECRAQSFLGVDAVLGFRLGPPNGDAVFEWDTNLLLWEAKLTEIETGLCADWSGTITLTEGSDVTSQNGSSTTRRTEHKTYTWQLNGACTRSGTSVMCNADLTGRTTGTETSTAPTTCGDPPWPSTRTSTTSWDSSVLALPGAQVQFTDTVLPTGRQFQFVWFIVNSWANFPSSTTSVECGRTRTGEGQQQFSYGGTYPAFFPKRALGPTDAVPTTMHGVIEHTDPGRPGWSGRVTYQLTSLPDDDHDGIPNL